MEIIRLALIVKDIDYGKALQKALASSGRGILVELIMPEDKEITIEEKDLIITEVQVTGFEKVVYLVEKSSRVIIDPEERLFCLYKYGGLSHLVDGINMAYCSYTGGQLLVSREKDIRITGFFSGQGGAGCSTLAMAFGGELVRIYKKRVLYLSLEEYESGSNYACSGSMYNRHICDERDEGTRNDRTGFEREESVGKEKKWRCTLNDYIYYLLSGRHNLCSCIETFLGKTNDGVDVFNVSEGSNPLRSLREPQFDAVIKSLTSVGKFDHLVMDIGATVSGLGGYAMDMCHRLCRVSEFDRKEKKGFHAVMKKSDRRADVCVVNKYYPIDVIFIDDDGRERVERAPRPEGIVIDFDRESFSVRDGREILAYDGEFGAGIRLMTGELLSNR